MDVDIEAGLAELEELEHSISQISLSPDKFLQAWARRGAPRYKLLENIEPGIVIQLDMCEIL